MLTNRELFEVYLELLKRVVTARGGDPESLAREFVWPEGDVAVPKAAESLSPLLTGGGAAPPWARRDTTPSGVVATPSESIPQGR
jgi:hypothetical protein